METNQVSSSPRKARVVLRAHGGKRHQLEFSDGSETHGSVSDAPDAVTASIESPHYDHSAWSSAPMINGLNKLIVSSPADLKSRNVFEFSIEHAQILHSSTPLKKNFSTDSDPRHSHSSPGVHGVVFKMPHSSSDSDSNHEAHEDEDSDDVFMATPVHRGHKEIPLRFLVEQNRRAKGSASSSTSLPPLPNGVHSRSKRRPYTSPMHPGSSTDSYPSPLHVHSSPEKKSSQKRMSRSLRAKRTSGKNCVHPDMKLRQTSPSYVTSDLRHSLSSSSHPNLHTDRLLSSSSNNSVLSMTLPPLLISELRRGGRTPSVEASWDFDAEAQLENCFPDRHIQVFVGTWNMQEQKDLPSCIDDLLLPLSHDTAADMYVIGTQESTPSRREWEVLIQQTLGPSYVLAQSTSLGIIYLLFYLRRDLIWYCSAVRSASYATRPGTLIKTKGGLGLSFTLFGSSFLFITSHFTAHDHKVKDRNSDMQRIAANLALSDSTNKTFVTDAFDHVFWFGDLNYRVELEREQADLHLADSDWMPLLMQDQLTREILQGNVFDGFSEQPITFPPSYKFDLHSDVYDSSEKRRTPSWTDRILFKSHYHFGIVGCGYDSCRALKTSDHRPVYGMFRVKLKPSKHIEGIPEQVVTFDREIYLKAQHKRRMVARQMSRQVDEPDGPSTEQRRPSSRTVTSSVCVIL